MQRLVMHPEFAQAELSPEAEAFGLADGGCILLRPVEPSDKPRFVRAFQRLSGDSRRRRFHAHKRELSEEDLRFFTEVDGENHVALVAVEKNAAGGESEVVGSARFIRLDNHPDTAEIAVTVVDSHQRRGIGTLLLWRLLDCARGKGIGRIRVQLLAENLPVRNLLERLLGPQELQRDGEIISGEIALDTSTDVERAERGPLFELLRLAAEEAVLPMNLYVIFSRAQLSRMRRRLASASARGQSEIL